MHGKDLLVSSYVVIRKGCPLAFSLEGSDHVQITCGRMPSDAFEILIERDAMQAFAEVCSDALQKMDAAQSR
jgi:hypothetical protein